MARTVSVKGLQDMQRENGQAAPEPNQDDEASARLKAPGYGAAGSDSSTTAEAPKAEPAAGPREYDVDSAGSVRDWRRPDTTPDRGVVPEVHTVTDEEPRFSGGGDGEAQQASLFLVPSDAAFNGALYRDAPELGQLAADLMERHGFLRNLEYCNLKYLWKRKTGVQKGRRTTGGLKRGTDMLAYFSAAEFIIFLAADTARERQFTDRRVERALFRQMLRIAQDDKGNWIEQPPDLNLFIAEITHYADVGDEDLAVGRKAYRNAEQMGLFSEDEDDLDDDLDPEPLEVTEARVAAWERYRTTNNPAPIDGSGVLIHADGTPMTAAEIEAMERRELDDDPYDHASPFDGAIPHPDGVSPPTVPADPDGPSPEDDDVLADPKVI